MAIIDKINMFFMKVLAVPMMRRSEKKEQALHRLDNAIKSVENSVVRFEILGGAIEHEYGGKLMHPRSLPPTISSMINIGKSAASTRSNPEQPKTEISDEDLREIEEYAKEVGISSMGYANVPHHLIFKDKAILYNKAIVCSFEMDADDIAKAPSIDTNVMIMRSYDNLGKAVIKIAELLKSKGYGAQAGHPLNGLVVYPPLAAAAGLGMHGFHGLIITPEYGPRVRLATVFTSIENLPITEHHEHDWIREYCEKCKICVKQCPGDAIFDKPIINPDNGIQTQTDNEKCFPEFLSKYGCTICVKVCPFATQNYDTLKSVWERKIKTQ